MGYEKNSPEPQDDGENTNVIYGFCAVRSPEPSDDGG